MAAQGEFANEASRRLLHVLHGNPGPDNQIAGFMLGWTFIKSKTILVPLAMHSGGNLIALGFQVAAWYFY